MAKGTVYILTNELMPGIVKIGKTIREVDQRVKELSDATGVPMPFKVGEYLTCPDCDWVEKEVHRRLEKSRANPGREFFRVTLSEASKILEEVHRENVEDWLNDFFPDHNIVHSDLTVRLETVHEKIADQPLYPPELVEVLEEAAREELLPAVHRVIERREARMADLESSKSQLRVVSDNG